MTDLSNQSSQSSKHDWHSGDANRRVRKRHARDRSLRYAGLGAIALALALLGILVSSLLYSGRHAFTQSVVELEYFIDPLKISRDDPAKGSYRSIVKKTILSHFPEVTNGREQRRIVKILSGGAKYLLRDHIVYNPEMVGKTILLELPLSDPYDQLHKGVIRRDLPENQRRISDREIAFFDVLVKKDLVSSPINWGLIFNNDSRRPELAGLRGAIVGSFYILLVCFLISFPVGIAAAVYLEEFAKNNKVNDLIEVNINNLAAVPSVVFGLLGLAVFLGYFELPRSAPLVGGMVLSLMTLPTIIIAARAALKAVPPSIREAALGMGASKHQVMMHHVLPLAMPGILTGTIIGLAQALGETAPLLLIGMNAFITSDPGSIMEPATALPTQIYSWADSPERGFTSRTSAAIIVLLGFLVIMNLMAIILRQKFEKKW